MDAQARPLMLNICLVMLGYVVDECMLLSHYTQDS